MTVLLIGFCSRYLHGEFMFARFVLLCAAMLFGFNMVALSGIDAMVRGAVAGAPAVRRKPALLDPAGGAVADSAGNDFPVAWQHVINGWGLIGFSAAFLTAAFGRGRGRRMTIRKHSSSYQKNKKLELCTTPVDESTSSCMHFVVLKVVAAIGHFFCNKWWKNDDRWTRLSALFPQVQ